MRLLRNNFLRDSFSRCPRRRSCPVVSPAFFSAPACRPSSQRYPHRTGIQFSSYTREGGMFPLIEIIRCKMAGVFPNDFEIFHRNAVLFGQSLCISRFKEQNDVCYFRLSKIILTIIPRKLLYISRFIPAKYNLISPIGTKFFPVLLLIQIFWGKMACVSAKCSQNVYNWNAKLEFLHLSRFYPLKYNHFSPAGTNLFQSPLLIQIWGVKCAVS